MPAISNYLKNKLVDLTLRGQAFTAPATVYVSLHTTATTDAGGGTEVTGGSYARTAVTASLANFAGTQGAGTTVASSGTSGQTSNNGAITFPTPTASWGTPSHFALWDAATGGNMLYHSPITTPKAIATGAVVTFAAGALSITFGA